MPEKTMYGIFGVHIIDLMFIGSFFICLPTTVLYVFYFYIIGELSTDADYSASGYELACQSYSIILSPIFAALLFWYMSLFIIFAYFREKNREKIVKLAAAYLTPAENMDADRNSNNVGTSTSAQGKGKSIGSEKTTMVILGAGTGVMVPPLLVQLGKAVNSLHSASPREVGDARATYSKADNDRGSHTSTKSPLVIAHDDAGVGEIDSRGGQSTRLGSSAGGIITADTAAAALACTSMRTYVCDAYSSALCTSSEELVRYNLRQEFKREGLDLVFKSVDADGRASSTTSTSGVASASAGLIGSSSLQQVSNVKTVYSDYVTLPFASNSIDVFVLPTGITAPYFKAPPAKDWDAPKSSGVAAGGEHSAPPDVLDANGDSVEPMSVAQLAMRTKIEGVFMEIYRVLKPGGRLVTFVSSMNEQEVFSLISKPVSARYAFGSLTPDSERDDTGNGARAGLSSSSIGLPSKSADAVYLSFLKSRVIAAVKRNVPDNVLPHLRDIESDTSFSRVTSLIGQRDGSIRKSAWRGVGADAENVRARLADLSVWSSSSGKLFWYAFMSITMQFLFWSVYVSLSIIYATQMMVPSYVPWSSNLLNFYTGNNTGIPILIVFNTVEYYSFIRDKMTAAVKDGHSSEAADTDMNRTKVWSLLYYQSVDMFLLLVVFGLVSFIPQLLIDIILIKSFKMSAADTNSYNIFGSMFVGYILYRFRLKIVEAYKNFNKGRTEPADIDETETVDAIGDGEAMSNDKGV